jgi:hypothetical protein
LTYGISVWGQANKSVLNCLLILQKKIIRIMNFANYQDDAIPLFYDLKILPMSFLYFYNTACIMHDIVNGKTPYILLYLIYECLWCTQF